jgi:hypothetical protein
MARKVLFYIVCFAFFYLVGPEALYRTTIAWVLLAWQGELPGQGFTLEQIAALTQIASFILAVYLLKKPSR